MEFVSPTRRSGQSGQIGIIVVLIMVVLLTLGLSLANRNTKDVALSTQEDESTHVFNGAEVGVEQALSSDIANLTYSNDVYTSSQINPAGSNANVTYTINRQYQLEMQIFQGVSATIQLVDATHVTPPASLVIDWSKEVNCATQSPASLLVSIYKVDKTKTPTDVKVRYATYEACGRSNSFTTAGVGTTVDANGYRNHVTIPLAAGDTFMRIKPVYNDTKMLVRPSSGQMPVQSYGIRSAGVNKNGSENRNVQVVRSLPTAPSIFDYVLFSGSTIVK